MNNIFLTTNIFSNIWGIVVAVFVLLFMVTIHELGHYIAGKKLGFKINEFSVGFGPAIFKKKVKSGEDFSLRIIPLGGYCAFEGEDTASSSAQAFDKQAPWKRIIVLASGALTNFFVTVIIVILTFSISGQFLIKTADIFPNAPSETLSSEYQLQEDDIILSVDGKNIILVSDLSDALLKAGKDSTKPIEIEVIRNGERISTQVILRDYLYQDVDGEHIKNGLGFTLTTESVKFGLFQTIGRSFEYCFKMAGEVLSFLGQLLRGNIGVNDVSGPIGTITITAQFAVAGLRYLLEIVALIGVNLAVFNLLPIPALDGSRIVFTVIEWIRGKAINRNVEAYIHFVGMLLLFAFAIMVDVLKWL